MDLTAIINSDIYSWVIIPLLIFLARIVDVSIGTLRVIFISKGFKYIAPFLGFFEVIIWLLAIRQIMIHLDNVFCYLAYGAGFGMGTFIGMYLEEKASIGKVIIRIITKTDATELLKNLKESNFHITNIDAKNSSDENVKIIFMVVPRQETKKIIERVHQFNPNAFYSIEDVRFAYEDGYNVPRSRWKHIPFSGYFRKSK